MTKAFILSFLSALPMFQSPNYRQMAVEQPDSLLAIVTERLPVSEEELIDMEISRAVALTKISKYDSVLSVLDDLESLITDLPIKDEFAINYQRARAYYFKGDYKTGIEYALDAVSIAESNEIDSLTVVGKMFAGELYRASDNNQFALKYLTEARDLGLKTNHLLGLAYSTNRIGVVEFTDNKLELADSLFSASMTIASQILDINVITMNLNDQGELYFALDQPGRSVELYQEALELDLPLDVEINTYNNMANALWKMRLYSESIEAASIGLEMADKAGILTLSERASRIIADCYMSQGNHEKGIEFYRRYMNYRGRLFDAQKDAQIAELETKYEVDKNRIRLESQERELQTQRKNLVYLIVGFSILSALLLVTVYFYVRSRKLQSALAESNKTKDKLFAIISHDLRSSLSAFQGIGQLLDRFLQRGEEKKLSATVRALDKEATELHQLLDNLLSWSLSEMKAVSHRPEKLDLGSIIIETKNLFEGLANLKAIEVRTDFCSTNVFADKSALELVFRNLVSNAIKFTEEGGFVKISSHLALNQVEIRVEDAGSGMSKAIRDSILNGTHFRSHDGTDGEKGTGLGLRICSEYLERHGSALEIEENKPKGTIFKFRLPIDE